MGRETVLCGMGGGELSSMGRWQGEHGRAEAVIVARGGRVRGRES